MSHELVVEFQVGDVLYDGFDTAALLHSPLECALDHLRLRFEFDNDAIVLVNDLPVSRMWYALQPGDEIRIVLDSNQLGRAPAVEEAHHAGIEGSGGEIEGDGSMRRSEDVVSPVALDKEGAAIHLGVKPATLDYLVRTRKIRYVQVGDQRGRVFRIKDLDRFLEENTQPTATEMLRKKVRS